MMQKYIIFPSLFLFLKNPAIVQDLSATNSFLAETALKSCIFAGNSLKLPSILKK